ncbi:hypothetical protein LINPERHAP2_LOCUS242 [Linum perenne]
MISLNSQLQKLQIKSGVDYFTLGDLCECYNEFSAYSVRTKVSFSSDSTANLFVFVNLVRNDPRSSGGDDAVSVMVENDLTDGDGGNNNYCNTTDKKFGQLYFSYFVVSSPYKRIPLRMKVYVLSLS